MPARHRKLRRGGRVRRSGQAKTSKAGYIRNPKARIVGNRGDVKKAERIEFFLDTDFTDCTD
jgi:hypothetical protein